MSVYEGWPRWRQRWFDLRVRWLGTEVFFVSGKLHCINCGTRILWRRVLLRRWRFTACPCCEDFTYEMCGLTK